MISIIQALREWINTCPYMDDFTGGQHVDWTDSVAGNYGIMPTGCADTQVVSDIMGNVVKHKQYNASIYARNWTVDDIVRLENAEFIDRFQFWVEDQQYKGLTPKFGDNPEDEVINAQNGMLFELSQDGQTGLYQIQLSVTFEKHYERT